MKITCFQGRGLRVKARYIVIIVLALIMGGSFSLVSSYKNQVRDPVYHGRHLSDWLRELPPAYSWETRSKARAAVRTIGTNGIPLLLKYLSQQDDSIVTSCRRKFESLLGIPASEESLFLRIRGVLGFEALGSLGHTAAPELKKLTLQKGLAYDAARALGASKAPDCLPFFVENLNSSVPEYRSAGAAGLGELGEAARPAVSKLIEMTEKEMSDRVRAVAVDSLGKIGPADVVVPILLQKLKNEESERVRCCAAAALANFPEKADELEKVLREAQKQDSHKVRSLVRLTRRKLAEGSGGETNALEK